MFKASDVGWKAFVFLVNVANDDDDDGGVGDIAVIYEYCDNISAQQNNFEYVFLFIVNKYSVTIAQRN